MNIEAEIRNAGAASRRLAGTAKIFMVLGTITIVFGMVAFADVYFRLSLIDEYGMVIVYCGMVILAGIVFKVVGFFVREREKQKLIRQYELKAILDFRRDWETLGTVVDKVIKVKAYPKGADITENMDTLLREKIIKFGDYIVFEHAHLLYDKTDPAMASQQYEEAYQLSIQIKSMVNRLIG